MNIKTNEEIHGHAVLQMMVKSGRKYSRDSLVAAIDEKFGANARFVICSGGNLNAAELVDTLIARGKFTGDESALEFHPASSCSPLDEPVP